ncbi:TDT family transporter [Streptomyces puniciscabiei]|uniref:hypothetical protein n=1 Tax=Streptomyces puniciscabiei TaxID=164348 RepID=UPI0007C6F0D4|nr:hypothetical protein [Streptomyces puniciscabiei]
MANLNARALAFMMGTGTVSTALYVNGADTASAVLLWVPLAGCAVLVPAYGWRLLRRRERFVADLLGPRAFAFLTLAISSNGWLLALCRPDTPRSPGRSWRSGRWGGWCWTTASRSRSSRR